MKGDLIGIHIVYKYLMQKYAKLRDIIMSLERYIQIALYSSVPKDFDQNDSSHC